MPKSVFGQRLRQLREGAGLSQTALAEKCGLTGNTVARIERGEHSPNWETALVIAEALGVDVLAFTEGKNLGP